MADRPTIDQLRTDEQALRREISRVLRIHICAKCGKIVDGGTFGCCAPGAFTGDLAVAERQLLRKVRAACDCVGDYTDRMSRACALVMESAVLATPPEWYAWEATPAERCIVCIEALGANGE